MLILKFGVIMRRISLFKTSIIWAVDDTILAASGTVNYPSDCI